MLIGRDPPYALERRNQNLCVGSPGYWNGKTKMQESPDADVRHDNAARRRFLQVMMVPYLILGFIVGERFEHPELFHLGTRQKPLRGPVVNHIYCAEINEHLVGVQPRLLLKISVGLLVRTHPSLVNPPILSMV